MDGKTEIVKATVVTENYKGERKLSRVIFAYALKERGNKIVKFIFAAT